MIDTKNFATVLTGCSCKRRETFRLEHRYLAFKIRLLLRMKSKFKWLLRMLVSSRLLVSLHQKRCLAKRSLIMLLVMSLRLLGLVALVSLSVPTQALLQLQTITTGRSHSIILLCPKTALKSWGM